MPNQLVFVVIAVVTVAIVIIRNHIKKNRELREQITEKWGKAPKKKYEVSEMESISSYFRNTMGDKKFFIDDITWNDLSMNEVFATINTTQSSVGEEVLYNQLRVPLFDKDELIKIDTTVELLSRKEEERVQIAYYLSKLGKERSACISDFFTHQWKKSNNLIYYRIMALLPILTIVISFFYPAAILAILLSLVANIYIHLQKIRETDYKMYRYSYLLSMIHWAKKITTVELEELKDYYKPVRESVKGFKHLNVRLSDLFPDVLKEYFRIFFLSDVIMVEKVSNTIHSRTDDLVNIYQFVGAMDCYISIASYRESLEYFTKPIFNQSDHKKINFEDIYHPLITNPIANSCEINKSMLLTGSNASGKSTFLKTVAINSILAQTIYTCLSRTYETSFFKTYTSMAMRDNLTGNESYYIVEIKSLKRIIEGIDKDVWSLCFVDEILRGTNTVERIAASSEVLKSLANSNCLCISATHDIELTKILVNHFMNYHFQEEIVNDEILFDYKLYPGRAQTRNAIKLLGIMGYDKEIVQNAEKRAESFLEKGNWSSC